MRLPPNLKPFLLFILFIILIILGIYYLPKLIPGIGEFLIGIILFGMFGLILFVFIKPFIHFLYARSDGIFELYMDASEKGFHVFSYHLNAAAEGMDSTRTIQHVFILIDTGKIYFNKLFTHDMTPTSGRSGWGDFYSFEENVLQSECLIKSKEKLSKRLQFQLLLGEKIKFNEENIVEIRVTNHIIHVKKFATFLDSGFLILCTDFHTNKLLWKKRI